MPRSTTALTEQMIAALIPAPSPRARPARPPLPRLPEPFTPPGYPADPQLDLAKLDPSGRVSARLLLDLLHWPTGHRLRFDVADHAITATTSGSGRHVVGARNLLPIPAAARQLCHLAAGDTVVLLADPARDLLVIHPAQLVARLLGARSGPGHAG
ncbi:hypothetical protein [Dactylosporangium salmoneum]|uniref:hypothetical protein n=1 Tax=Dactylosporangium salmoneum TaxID=53361 RepID=UPI0031DF835E